MIKQLLGALVLVLAFAVGASAQESEVSGGGGTAGAITAAPGSGNAGRVPQFASTTSLVDSKMLTSGTNSGTWTLYDSTASTGVSQLFVRTGPGQSTTSQLLIGSTSTGLFESAAGILKVTDGSTGSGGVGISDAATNTVTDALILRHATSGTAAASFGTGLLFQGENAAGTMHDMASIQAVYSDATNGSEDADLRTYGVVAGTLTRGPTLSAAVRGNNPGMYTATHMNIEADGQLFLGGSGAGAYDVIIGNYSVANYWKFEMDASGQFAPMADNTYDFGYPTLKIKDSYLGTSIQGTRTQAISDAAAAATFVTIAVPTSNTTVGGRIFYTITAIDAGTAIQTKTGTYSFGLNNIGGTVTGAGTDVLEHPQLSTGTLAPTFSVNISGTDAQFQLVLDTSLDAGAETLKIEYRVQIDSGTATVTPAT